MSKHHAGISTRPWRRKREIVFATHGRYCVYCGDEATQIDHVHPISDTHYWEATGQDPNALENLVPACSPCNIRKSNKKTKQQQNYFNKNWLQSI